MARRTLALDYCIGCAPASDAKLAQAELAALKAERDNYRMALEGILLAVQTASPTVVDLGRLARVAVTTDWTSTKLPLSVTEGAPLAQSERGAL